MSSWRAIVEKELGVKLPDEYADYLQRYGIYEEIGIQIYGMSDTLLGYHSIPCVIGATHMLREDDDLPHRFIALQYTGFEDEYICLDTESQEVWAMSVMMGNSKLADTFNEWFYGEIIGRKEERRKRREEYERKWKDLDHLNWSEED